MNFKEKYIIFLVMFTFICVGLYYSYALFVTKQLQENVVAIKTPNNVLTVLTDNETNRYQVNGKSKVDVNLMIKNNNSITYYYEVFFKKNQTYVQVTSLDDAIKGTILGGETKNISVVIDNKGDDQVEIEFFIQGSQEEEFDKEIGYSYINLKNNYDHSGANKPVLNGFNLIPVTYQNGEWITVEDNNSDNLWYDYDSGIWANAVLVNSNKYQKYIKQKETQIEKEDILGYYVWIPRFKYNVMNYNNYTNLEKMNNVIFEKNNAITGTVTCYDSISNNSDKHFFSEACKDNKYKRIYNNLSTYTHPAFGNKNGFWVSKFLMGRESDTLKSVANLQMVKENVYNAIDLSNNIIKNKSHLLTNMEYSSIVILSNSQYGKSNNSSYLSEDNYVFKRIYTNNYLYDVTGCSSDYSLYSKKFITTTSKECVSYDDMTDLSHVANSVKYPIGEVGPGASTTGTIYGVYDMASINGELVAAIATNMENSITLGEYQDVYSYNNYVGKIASSGTIHNLYRYKLGDSIRENVRSLKENGMWQGGSLEQKKDVGVFLRGGNSDIKDASVYTASVVDFSYQAPFRVSLS